MGIAFALVAIVQKPSRRWRVLALFTALTAVNKSVYALMLLVLLSIGCLATLARKALCAAGVCAHRRGHPVPHCAIRKAGGSAVQSY